MIKYYIQNKERHSKRYCKCTDSTALFKLCGQFVNEKDIGFWECCNCGEKKPYRPHQKLFKLIEERI